MCLQETVFVDFLRDFRIHALSHGPLQKCFTSVLLDFFLHYLQTDRRTVRDRLRFSQFLNGHIVIIYTDLFSRRYHDIRVASGSLIIISSVSHTTRLYNNNNIIISIYGNGPRKTVTSLGSDRTRART